MTTLFSFQDDRYSDLKGVTFVLEIDEDGKYYKYEKDEVNNKEYLECIDGIIWLVNQLKDYLDRINTKRPYKRARNRLINSVEQLYVCDRTLESMGPAHIYHWSDGRWVEE